MTQENNIIFEDEKPLTPPSAEKPQRGRQNESQRGRVYEGVPRESEFMVNFNAGSLEIPERYVNIVKQKGYHLRWVRVLSGGQPDTPNILKRLRQGYTFLKEEDCPEITQNYVIPQDVGSFKGILSYGDVALMKRPLELQEEARRQLDQLNNQEAEDLDAKTNGIRKVKGEHRSETQVLRGPRKPKFGA